MSDIRVVRGRPTDEEFAAVVVILMRQAAAARDQDRDRPTHRSGWLDRTALVRAPLRPGPQAWRASALRRM